MNGDTYSCPYCMETTPDAADFIEHLAAEADRFRTMLTDAMSTISQMSAIAESTLEIIDQMKVEAR